MRALVRWLLIALGLGLILWDVTVNAIDRRAHGPAQ